MSGQCVFALSLLITSFIYPAFLFAKNSSSLALLWFQKWRRRSCSWPQSVPPTSTARTSLSPEGTDDDTTPEADRAEPRQATGAVSIANLSQWNCVRLLYRMTILTVPILASRRWLTLQIRFEWVTTSSYFWCRPR